eukprot:ANDGO_06436.mRNA.1 Histidine kinase 2
MSTMSGPHGSSGGTCPFASMGAAFSNSNVPLFSSLGSMDFKSKIPSPGSRQAQTCTSPTPSAGEIHVAEDLGSGFLTVFHAVPCPVLLIYNNVVEDNREIVLANRFAEQVFESRRGCLDPSERAASLVGHRLKDVISVLNPSSHAEDQKLSFVSIPPDAKYMIVTIPDETWRLRAEEDFQLAVEAAPNAMIMVDHEGRILLVNSQTEKVFGWLRDELLGNSIEMLIPVRFRGDHPSFRQQFMKHPSTRAMGATRDLSGLHKDGREIPVEVGLNPIFPHDGSRDGVRVLASVIDITERKRVEQEEARARKAALEAELANAREKTHAEFLARMSHEIRTPLNAVIGLTEFLLYHTELSAEQKEYAETVRGAGAALLSTVNDILDFSKLEAGSCGIEIVDFDVAAVIQNALGLIAGRAHIKHLGLVQIIDARVPVRVRGDPSRLLQIILNLVGNACKFTDQGGVTVTIMRDVHPEDNFHAPLNLRQEDDEKVDPADVVSSIFQDPSSVIWLTFTVTDTGIGIPGDRRQFLFKPFSQADVSTTRRYGGTGLGLAIVKRIVDAFHGTVDVETPSGPGTSFVVRLPFLSAGASSDAPASDFPNDNARWFMDGELSWEKAISPARTLRLFVADDCEIDRIGLVAQLSKHWKINTDSRGDLRSDLQGTLEYLLARATAYDVIIISPPALDLQSPKNDGSASPEAEDGVKHTTLPGNFGSVDVDWNGFRASLKAVNGSCIVAWLTSLSDPSLWVPLNEEMGDRVFTKPLQPEALATFLVGVARNAAHHPERGTPRIHHHSGKGDAQEEKALQTTIPCRRGRILLVEDNPVNQKVALLMLKRIGYVGDDHIIVAENGEEAISKLRQESSTFAFDVILMDCQMPVMDGFAATREIRLFERRHGPFSLASDENVTIGVPIIAMTAHALKGDRERCLTAGMDDYLSKPVDAKKLECLLKKYDTALRESLVEYIKNVILDGDVDAFEEVVTSFLNSTPAIMDQLRKDIADRSAGDAPRGQSIFSSVHYMKGCTLYVGACRLHALCARACSLMRKSVSDNDSAFEVPEAMFQLCTQICLEYDIVFRAVMELQGESS